jgi:hypothetical protein
VATPAGLWFPSLWPGFRLLWNVSCSLVCYTEWDQSAKDCWCVFCQVQIINHMTKNLTQIKKRK